MCGHAQQCVERYCALSKSSISKLKQVATPCVDDHLIKPEDLDIISDFQLVPQDDESPS